MMRLNEEHQVIAEHELPLRSDRVMVKYVKLPFPIQGEA